MMSMQCRAKKKILLKNKTHDVKDIGFNNIDR